MVKRQSEKQIIKGQSRGAACESCDRRRYFGLWSAPVGTHPPLPVLAMPFFISQTTMIRMIVLLRLPTLVR